MRRKISLSAALVGMVVLACFGATASASATFHDIKIRAVFKGPADVSFVELQMFSAGQNATSGRHLTFYDHNGLLTHTSPPLPNVASGENQRTILIADTLQATTPDLVYGTLYQNFNEDANGGAVCYENVDCFAWGPAFNNPGTLPSPVGTAAAGLSGSQVLARNITANCPTALDAADDTDNSTADFGFTVGFPVRPNATAPTEVVCPPPPATTPKKKKKCKKAKKRSSAELAKKKCKKKKKR